MKTDRALVQSVAALGLLSLPAAATADTGAYAAVQTGVAFPAPAKFDVLASPDVADGIIIKHKSNAEFGAILGYDFGRVRTELEFSRASLPIYRVDATVAIPTEFFPPTTSTPNPAPATTRGTFSSVTGRTRNRIMMANVVADLGTAAGVQGFVGVGVGRHRFQAVQYSVSPKAAFLKGKDAGLAWQLFVGARWPLSDHLEAAVKYRYLRQTRIDLADTLNRRVSTQLSSQSALVGLAYRF